MTTTPDPSAAALRERLSRLSAASLRINESIDLDTVLQDVLDSARALAGARYGMLHVLDDAGRWEKMLASGIAEKEFPGLWEIPGWEAVYRYLGALPGPLRVPDFDGHIRGLGLPEFHPPAPSWPCPSCAWAASSATSTSPTASPAKRSAPATKRRWPCSRRRRRSSSSTRAGTATSAAPAPAWRR